MSQELWDSLINKIELNFGNIEIQKLRESFFDDLENEIESKIERVEITVNDQKIRLEKVVKPMILDKKSHYSRGSGNHTAVEYILSDTETTTSVRAFKFNDDMDEWEEINLRQAIS